MIHFYSFPDIYIDILDPKLLTLHTHMSHSLLRITYERMRT